MASIPNMRDGLAVLFANKAGYRTREQTLRTLPRPSRAALAQPRNREMREVGLKSRELRNRLLEWHCVGIQQLVGLAAALTDQVDVIVVTRVMVGGSAAQMRMRHNTHLLEKIKRSVDGGVVDARKLVLDAPYQVLGGNVAARVHNLRHDRPSLRSHSVSPVP